MLARLQRRYTVTPRTHELVAYAALGVLTLIVFTGAAVRLTGSGLGCPTWPKCTDTSLTTPLETHGVIEFANRALTGLVGLPCLLALATGLVRKPYRRDFAFLGLGLCVGVLSQAVLGGITVRTGLNPWTVMSHFVLSMVLLAVALLLVWRARRDRDARRVEHDGRLVTAVRALFAFGAVVIVAGTAATAAGPHAGGSGTGDEVQRLDFKGAQTLDFVIKGHARLAALFGVCCVLVWWLARRRGADAGLRRTLTAVCVLLAVQGAVGTLQYQLELPAEIVWVHVALAALTWNALTWSLLSAGRPSPAPAAALAVHPTR